MIGNGLCANQPKAFDYAISRLSDVHCSGKKLTISIEGFDFQFKASSAAAAVQVIKLIQYRKSVLQTMNGWE